MRREGGDGEKTVDVFEVGGGEVAGADGVVDGVGFFKVVEFVFEGFGGEGAFVEGGEVAGEVFEVGDAFFVFGEDEVEIGAEFGHVGVGIGEFDDLFYDLEFGCFGDSEGVDGVFEVVFDFRKFGLKGGISLWGL